MVLGEAPWTNERLVTKSIASLFSFSYFSVALLVCFPLSPIFTSLFLLSMVTLSLLLPMIDSSLASYITSSWLSFTGLLFIVVLSMLTTMNNFCFIWIWAGYQETVKRLRDVITVWDVIKILGNSNRHVQNYPSFMKEMENQDFQVAVERLKTRKTVRELMSWMESAFPDVVNNLLSFVRLCWVHCSSTSEC